MAEQSSHWHSFIVLSSIIRHAQRRGAVARWVEEWHDTPYVLCLFNLHQSLPRVCWWPSWHFVTRSNFLLSTPSSVTMWQAFDRAYSTGRLQAHSPYLWHDPPACTMPLFQVCWSLFENVRSPRLSDADLRRLKELNQGLPACFCANGGRVRATCKGCRCRPVAFHQYNNCTILVHKATNHFQSASGIERVFIVGYT